MNSVKVQKIVMGVTQVFDRGDVIGSTHDW